MSDKKILIIDDDQHLQLGLTARLKANGYRVISAMDGISGVTLARKEMPDLIMLDLGLPAGDGFLVLERLKSMADLVAIPVIVLSARDPAGSKQRALDAGAVSYLQKPPDNHELLTTVRHALGETIALSSFLKT